MLRLSLLAEAAGQHRRPVDLDGAVSVEAPFGELYAHEHDDSVTPTLAAHRVWEPGETAFLEARLRPGMTFLDVGAHVGYFSVLAGRLVGARGLVLAFEPEPRNYELLLANVWRHGLTNAACFPWAVSATSGFADLHVSESNTGDHRIVAAGEERQTVTVRTVALDALEVLRPPVDVVKVDTQGTEHLAILGMARLLVSSPDVVLIVEFWPHGIRLAGGEPASVLAFYRSLGFELAVDGAAREDAEILSSCEGEAFTNLVLTRP
jgi:FkbM family methyltransferase